MTTIQELKSNYPSLYAQVVSEGVAQEKDRVEAWLVFFEDDPKAVIDGIKAGSQISVTTMKELANGNESKDVAAFNQDVKKHLSEEKGINI